MVATVHYLSMNVHSGRVAPPEPEFGGFQYTFTADSLAPSLSHTIDWGDGGSTSVVSTDSSGNISTTHTYALPGTYTIQITETVGGRIVGREDAVVTVKLGTLVVPGSIIENVAASFSGSGFDKLGAYSIAWGDGSGPTTGTTDAAGAIGATAHTFPLHGTFPVVVTMSSVVVASGDAVVDYNDGVVTFTIAVTANVGATLTGSSFAFNRSYDVDWGDGTSHDTVTSSGAGGFTHAHTYTAADTYNVVVKDGAHTSATLSQVVGA